MNVRTFQDLQVWQRGHELVLGTYRITRKFPDTEKFGLVTQLRRSAVSVCANIAEGGKKSRKDFHRFLEIADGSLEETKYHLILAKDLRYISENEFELLFEKANTVGRMLNGLKNSLNLTLNS